MPQLDKLTYFTQFFWSCPFLLELSLSFFISQMVSLCILAFIFFLPPFMDSTCRSFFYPSPNWTLFLQLLFLAICYLFLFYIPVPDSLEKDKLIVLKVLGGSSSILYVVLDNCSKTRFFLVSCLMLSDLSVFLCMGETLYASITICFYLCVFFFPITSIFFTLLILRAFSFGPWGLSLLMLLGFLVAFKRLRPIKFFWFFYLLFTGTLTFIIFKFEVPLLVLQLIYLPFSGALVFYLLFLATSAKEHLATTFLYLTNGIFVGVVFGNLHSILYLLSVFLVLFFIFLFIPFLRIRNQNKRLEEFPSELHLSLKDKDGFILTYYGILLYTINFYCNETSAHFWLKDFVFSVTLQLLFITFLLQVIKPK